MEIEYFLTTLIPREKLNRFDVVGRETLLLRINERYYLNYHPWQEFGDKPCSEILEQVTKTKTLPTFLNKLLELEKIRLNIKNENFFNHSFGLDHPGIPITKIKYLDSIETVISKIKKTSKKLRIDFNLGLNKDEFQEFLSRLSLEDIQKIDYIEDPCDLNENTNINFQKTPPLASDRVDFVNGVHHFNIYKPNIDCAVFHKNSIISNYMGHDLGIYHCYLFLQQYGDLDLYHGVVTPCAYEGSQKLFTEFKGKFKINQTKVKDLYSSLEELKWKKI